MTDQDVVYRFCNIVGCGNILSRSCKSGKPFWLWKIGAKADVTRVLEMLLPYLGQRRQELALEALEEIASRRCLA